MEKLQLNFVGDWQRKMLNDIKKEGLEIPNDIRTESLIIKYFTYLRKKRIKQSYNVYKSKNFRYLPEFTRGLDQIINILKDGGDISPYLSKGVVDLEDDPMFNDWGVLHLHLGEKMEKNTKYIKRTGPLLFVYFKERNAYLINIYNHGDWTKKDVLQTMYNNWPELIEPFILKELSGLSTSYLETDHKKLRSSGSFVLVELSDKKGNKIVIMPPGLGLASSGDAIIDIQGYDDKVERVMMFEELIMEEINNIKDFIHGKDIKTPETFKFSLIRCEGKWYIKEQNTNLILPALLDVTEG